MNRLHVTLAFAGAGLLLSSGRLRAGITANTVTGYTPGDFSITATYTGYQNAGAALGALTGDTGFGGLNPFNPAFSTNQIVAIGAGGELTLHLSGSVPVSASPTLGVFSNNGLFDVSGGSGVASNPATTFDDPTFPEAIVSVSPDGINYVGLDGLPVTANTAPTTFANPTNYYTDQEIEPQVGGYGYQPLGSAIADQFKPFTGSLTDFGGASFDGIKATLDGSAGGNWLDLSGTGLSSINYVRFDVPTGAAYAFFVDSVSAVPEPVIGLPMVMGGLLLARGRRRR